MLRILMLLCLIIPAFGNQKIEIINDLRKSVHFTFESIDKEQNPDNDNIYVAPWIKLFSPETFCEENEITTLLWELDHKENYPERLYFQVELLDSPLVTSFIDFIDEIYFSAMNLKNRSLQLKILDHLLSLPECDPVKRGEFERRKKCILQSSPR